MSETAKHRHLVEKLCSGNGVDLGSSGDPIVPWAISVELPFEQYHNYNQDRPNVPIQWRGSAADLPFKNGVLDFVHSSHLLEDFLDWVPILTEWDRVLKKGGYLIISVPDNVRFRSRVSRGLNGDNLSHKHESYVGELTKVIGPTYEVLMDKFVNEDPEEYSIIWAGRKR